MAKKRIHRVPHEEIKSVLYRHGVRSVNQAVEWGQTASEIIFPEGHRFAGQRRYPLVSAKSVEGIVRGKRVLGVEFDRVDQILCALDSPEEWYGALRQWYYPRPPNHEPEFETFISQTAAFDMACEMFRGGDSVLLAS